MASTPVKLSLIHIFVLLDEIEKAHPDVFNILLQVLDEEMCIRDRYIWFLSNISIMFNMELESFNLILIYSLPHLRNNILYFMI